MMNNYVLWFQVINSSSPLQFLERNYTSSNHDVQMVE